MLLYLFPALLTPSLRTVIIKSNVNNGRKPLPLPFPVITFNNEEATGCINEEAIGAINEASIDSIISPKNPPSCFFIA